MFKELDYTREAANAIRFKKLFLRMPEVYVPNMYTEYTKIRVMTMEWIEGERLRTAADGEARIGGGGLDGGWGGGLYSQQEHAFIVDRPRTEEARVNGLGCWGGGVRLGWSGGVRVAVWGGGGCCAASSAVLKPLYRSHGSTAEMHWNLWNLISPFLPLPTHLYT